MIEQETYEGYFYSGPKVPLARFLIKTYKTNESEKAATKATVNFPTEEAKLAKYEKVNPRPTYRKVKEVAGQYHNRYIPIAKYNHGHYTSRDIHGLPTSVLELDVVSLEEAGVNYDIPLEARYKELEEKYQEAVKEAESLRKLADDLTEEIKKHRTNTASVRGKAEAEILKLETKIKKLEEAQEGSKEEVTNTKETKKGAKKGVKNEK